MDSRRLHEHLVTLATVPRPCHSKELEAAREYVTRQMEDFGWTVRRHEFSVFNDVGDLNLEEQLHGVNLIATRSDCFQSERPRLCVGAHLDSRPDTPGADDNASAVAVLLEIARLIPSLVPKTAELELELVAFDLEENGMLGGREHARLAKQDGVDLRGMISLEMLGYCDHAKGSQQLPRSLVGLYPDTGDFLAIIGNQNSGELITQFHSGAKSVEELPLETLQVPENGELLQATRLSDHSPFWDAGYSALMITDTSFLRNPHYHQSTDTVDTLDSEFLFQVAKSCLKAIKYLLAAGLSAT